MRLAVGQTLLVVLLVGCSTRQPVLPPPAPPAPAAALPSPAPEPSVEAARRGEEAVEQVDVSALQERNPAPAAGKRELPAPATAARLRARVIDSLGQPVEGALVVLRSLSGGDEHRARSGADGGLTFAGLAPGDYLLACDPNESPEVAAIPLHLAGGDAPDTVEIRLGAPHSQGTVERDLSRPLVLA